MPLSSPISIMLTLYDAASETNKSSLQRLQTRAQALEIVETQCSKSLDGYHLRIEDLCINLNVEMA